ncbi:MAG TPA: DUF1330 domain-containing protein [Sphingomicrobium sp.]|jgi:uncharacterized protein (DUF1330 family)
MARALVVANIRFKDRARYDAYAAAFPAVFANSGGKMLAADEAPQLESGDGSGVDKIVVMRFDSEEAARSFLNSPEYVRIAEDRDAGADVTAWIVKAF